MGLVALSAATRPQGPYCGPEPAADLGDEELLARVMGRGEPGPRARSSARALLEASGGLGRLRLVPRGVLEQCGLSPESIDAVQAALELSAREAAAPPPQPMSAGVLAAMFRPLLVHLPHEEMHAVLLDGRGRFAGRRRVSAGGAAACSLYVRDVLGPVLEARAHAFALVHNHPSGCCQPSPEDVGLTARVAEAGDVVGARLIDHLVVAVDGFSSAMPSGARWSHPGRTLARVL